MSEKKYRACLIGVVILMVVLGVFICVDGINRQKGCVKGIWDSRKLSI